MIGGLLARASAQNRKTPPLTSNSEVVPVSRRRTSITPTDGAGGISNAGDKLTQADVVCLRSDPSARARALVAQKLCEQADSLIEEGHNNLVAAILGLLVKDVETEVRRSLAQAMQSSPNLPVQFARKLARDRVEIATPILQSSPVLSDQDLIEIVRTSAMQYSLAIAARDKVGENLSQALVDTGHGSVVACLLENKKAHIAESTYEQVLEDFGSDGDIQERLVRRIELPKRIIDRLTRVIGDRIENKLVQESGIDAETAHQLIETATQNAAITRTARDCNEETLRKHLRMRFKAGELDHDEVVRLLQSGDVAAFEMAMSIIAAVDFKRSRQMLYHKNRRHLMAICAAAEFAPMQYVGLHMAIEVAEESLSEQGAVKAYSSEFLNELFRQYERLSRDPESVADIIDGHLD